MPSIGYSSASEAREAREALGAALEALQRDENIPKEVLAIAQNIARSIGALFEAEYASTEVDGKTCIKSALGTLSQTLALMQDVKSEHHEVQAATESIAQVISVLFPLTNKPSVRPDASASSAPPSSSPPSSKAPPNVASSRPPLRSVAPSSVPPRSRPPSTPPLQSAPSSRPPSSPPSSRPPSTRPSSLRPPSIQPPSFRPAPDRPPVTGRPPTFASSLLPPPPPVPEGARHRIEANLGATTQSNFYVGFSGEIAHGGVFLATYEMLPKDTSVTMLVTLPGGFEFECDGYVRFVRDPLDFASESEPGIGIQFEALPDDARNLVLRFIRNRPPIFYDVS
jgi:uncharacterized protein (TIGR02266 family)